MARLNTVSYEEALSELGEYGLLQLAQLDYWLNTLNPRIKEKISLTQLRGRWKARIAPSIIARGFAELFAVSTPRFGLRVYVGKSQRSFVNAIRMGTFCDQVQEWGQRDKSLPPHLCLPLIDSDKGLVQPEKLFRKDTCIGDSILEIPKRLRYCFTLARDFGKAYGEGEFFKGVPFVRTSVIAGLCAQAACFMATALMQGWASGVYSVPEITKLANTTTKREILISGLSSSQIVNYFNLVNLNSSIDYIGASARLPERSLPHALAISIKAYIRSGFPVLLPIDFGRMGGLYSNQIPGDSQTVNKSQCIFADNGLSQDCIIDRHEQLMRHHIVAVIGYSEHEALLQDPSTLPFLKASWKRIIDASVYSEPLNEGFNRGNEMSELSKGLIIPVLPKPVRLFLAGDEKGARNGVLDLSRKLYDEMVFVEGCQKWNDEGSEFLLVRVGKDPERVAAFIQEVWFDPDGAPLNIEDDLIVPLGSRWVWLQAFERGLWVWDAERMSIGKDLHEEVQAHILLRIDWMAAGLEVTKWKSPTLKQQPAEPLNEGSMNRGVPTIQSQRMTNLRMGMISSFLTKGLNEWTDKWPSEICDLYCFMQQDANAFLKSDAEPSVKQSRAHASALWRNRLRKIPLSIRGINPFRWKLGKRFQLALVKPQCGVLTQLASLFKNGRDWYSDASRVAEVVKAQLTKWGNPELSAITTFFPEISARSQELRDDAVKAVGFLMHLGTWLNSAACEHGQFSLELVSGGISDGIWPLSASRNAPYILSLRDPKEVMDAFLGSLRELWPFARTTGVKLSVECEPGPLFLLGSVLELEDFCRIISKERSPLLEAGEILTESSVFQSLSQSVSFEGKVLWGHLSRSARQGIESAEEGSAAWEHAIQYALNELIEGNSLLEMRELVADIDMSRGTRSYLRGHSETSSSKRAWENRKLLEDFLPGVLVSSPSCLGEFVGVNVDIAHWAFLKGIRDPEQIDPVVRKCIFSAHISDHAQGAHFGDAMPFELHGKDDFERWMRFFNESLELPRFTGLMSCEFEAAPKVEDVKEFARRLGLSTLLENACAPEETD